MFRKSPYLNKLPVLSLQSEQLSRYKLRRSQRDEHFLHLGSGGAVFGAGG
jgi:DTW domain-containing protein YfiP